jgi:hypothetical protein
MKLKGIIEFRFRTENVHGFHSVMKSIGAQPIRVDLTGQCE